MKISTLKFLHALSIGILGTQAFAADYYFSESGNDSRPSTQGQEPNTPGRSIEKLNSVFQTLKPGDAIYFKRGEVFTGTIRINKSGAAGRPIKIGAYGSGDKPVITSLVSLAGWKSIGGGIYESGNSLG